MNNEQKDTLNQMIKENDTKDNTEYIKEVKNSKEIRRCVAVIQNLKRNSKHSSEELNKLAITDCGFLFTHYPNIYNKLLKNEIDIKILYSFLDELESIEEGKQNQHEASYKIGLLLKKMYVDKQIDLSKEETGRNPPKKISYAEYKKLQK